MKKFGLFVDILLSQLSFSISDRIGCGSNYDPSKWDCDAFQHYFSQSNVEKTLYCIGYNKMISPKRALNMTDLSNITVQRHIRLFDRVDENDQIVKFEEFIAIKYYHKQLEFVTKDCDYLSMSFEYRPEILFTFLPKTILGHGLNLRDLSFGLHLVRDSKKTYKSIKILRISKLLKSKFFKFTAI